MAERRARVLAWFAENPTATFRMAADALGSPKTTVERDPKAALAGISTRTRDAFVASMIARNEAIVNACMPLTLRRGSVAHGQLALAADKRTAELLGLNAPAKVEHLHRQIAERAAAESGA